MQSLSPNHGDPLVLRRTWLLWAGIATLTLCGLVLAALQFGTLHRFERDTLNPGVTSDLTPADFGTPFERVAIHSGDRKLDAWLVKAAPGCSGQGAGVLIFHGRGETIADWISVQQDLQRHCVTSLIFDYAGHGHSSGTGSVARLDEDGLAAANWFLNADGLGARRCLLGHSMGNAVMLQAAIRMAAQPACIVLASPFASLRAMALENGLPTLLAFTFPDVWNNLKAARAYSGEALWVHSRNDTTVPFAAGEAVFSALRGAKTAVVVSGLAHNAIYQDRPEAIWGPILGFLRASHATAP